MTVAISTDMATAVPMINLSYYKSNSERAFSVAFDRTEVAQRNIGAYVLCERPLRWWIGPSGYDCRIFESDQRKSPSHRRKERRSIATCSAGSPTDLENQWVVHVAISLKLTVDPVGKAAASSEMASPFETLMVTELFSSHDIHI